MVSTYPYGPVHLERDLNVLNTNGIPRIRYAVIILLTCVNTIGLIRFRASKSGKVFVRPHACSGHSRLSILFSIALIAIDGYWDRSRAHGFSKNLCRFILVVLLAEISHPNFSHHNRYDAGPAAITEECPFIVMPRGPDRARGDQAAHPVRVRRLEPLSTIIVICLFDCISNFLKHRSPQSMLVGHTQEVNPLGANQARHSVLNLVPFDGHGKRRRADGTEFEGFRVWIRCRHLGVLIELAFAKLPVISCALN